MALTTSVAIIALFWWVHAAVVLASVLGAWPLRNRWLARTILALGLVGVGIVVKRVTAAARGRNLPSITIEAAAKTNRGIDRYPAVVGGLITAFAVVALAAVALTAVYLPMTAYDALGYRVPTIAQWLDAGRIQWVTSDDPVRNGYPMGLEAIGAVVAASFNSMALVDLLSVPLLVAGAMGVWLMAALAGVRPALAVTASAVFVLAPIGLLNAPSGYVDAAFSGALVMALKGTGFAFVAVALLAAGGRGYFAKSLSASKVGWIVLFSLPGLFWITRNAVFTGNPLWPIDLTVAGIHLLSGVSPVDSIMDVVHNTPPELRNHQGLVQVILTWLQPWGPATGFDERLAGLGYAWPVAAVPAISGCMVTAVRKKAYRNLPVFVIALTGLWFVLQPMRWWSRYTLWLWGAGALALALTAEALVARARRKSLALGLTLVAALCVGEGAFTLYYLGGIGPHLTADPKPALADIGFNNVRRGAEKFAGLDPSFWKLGLDRSRYICRGSWKRGTDDANLDGLFAQLQPRPHVLIFDDERTDWPAIKAQWLRTACDYLVLMSKSPLVTQAQSDPSVQVVRAIAFDPLFVVNRL